jgi:hypothetical protein
MHPSGVPGRVNVRQVSITQGATATSSNSATVKRHLIEHATYDGILDLCSKSAVYVARKPSLLVCA